jgi:hypothetical protein
MSQAWQLLARNYARFDTPLRPNEEILVALKNLQTAPDPLVVVLGGTPLFAGLGRRVWFVDMAQDALRLPQVADKHRLIHKNWLDASDELAQADLIVGDASINALDSRNSVMALLRLLAQSLRPGATLALRVFVQHGLPETAFQQRLAQAFAGRRYSEVRFLVYGVVASSNGETAVNAIDHYVDTLEAHLATDQKSIASYKEGYFEWRGISASAAAAIDTRAFIPLQSDMEALFSAASLRCSTVSAGTFPLAEFTPIYVARG